MYLLSGLVLCQDFALNGKHSNCGYKTIANRNVITITIQIVNQQFSWCHSNLSHRKLVDCFRMKRNTQNRFVFGRRIFHFTWKIEAFKTHIDPNKSHVMSSHAWIEIYFFPEDLINASIHNRYRKNRKMMGTSHFFHPLTCLYNLMCSAKNKTVRLFHAEKIVFFSSYAYRWYVPFLTKKQSFASHINEANIFCVDLQ